jgi:hypothetical protein
VGFALFATSMWLRGATEVVMLYGTKTWRPPMGIAHDALCVLLLLASLLVQRDGLLELWTSTVGRASAALYALLCLSLLAEMYYAYAFFKAVEGRTTGEHGVWFADQRDPRFARINKVTAAGNALFGAGLLCFFIVSW